MASEHGSRYTGPSVVEESHHGGGGGLGQALAGGALGAGLASMFQRRQRSRHASQSYEESRTSISDEKYSDESSRHHGGWGKKILELGALAGAGMLAKKWWDRRRGREEDTESGRYRPAHTRTDSYSEGSLSRLEDGRPDPSHPTPLNRPPTRPPSRPQSPGSSYYYNSTYFTEPPQRHTSHGARDAILGAGAFAAVKRMFSRKGKEDDEKRRLDDIRRREEEDEQLQRANSKRRQQSEGVYPQRRRPSSYTESDLTPTDLTPQSPRPPGQPSGSSLLSPEPVATGAAYPTHSDIPPLPPVHHELSSDLGPPPSRYSRSHHAEELAAGAAMGAASSHRRSDVSRRDGHVESPPVSVKVKMHNDGRHVTLRRLTEEEAAAQREARRRERRNSRRRGSSTGSLSGGEREADRWRRVEETERRQAEQIRREQQAAMAASAAPSGSMPPSPFPQSQSQISVMPPPPPIPHPAPSSMPYGPGSVTSPGTWTGTEASGSYANNRRRRRAERARARQDRQQRPGVEFE